MCVCVCVRVCHNLELNNSIGFGELFASFILPKYEHFEIIDGVLFISHKDYKFSCKNDCYLGTISFIFAFFALVLLPCVMQYGEP